MSEILDVNKWDGLPLEVGDVLKGALLGYEVLRVADHVYEFHSNSDGVLSGYSAKTYVHRLIEEFNIPVIRKPKPGEMVEVPTSLMDALDEFYYESMGQPYGCRLRKTYGVWNASRTDRSLTK